MIITDGSSLERDKLISENQEQKIMSDSFVSDKNYVPERSSVNLLQRSRDYEFWKWIEHFWLDS